MADVEPISNLIRDLHQRDTARLQHAAHAQKVHEHLSTAFKSQLASAIERANLQLRAAKITLGQTVVRFPSGTAHGGALTVPANHAGLELEPLMFALGAKVRATATVGRAVLTDFQDVDVTSGHPDTWFDALLAAYLRAALDVPMAA